MTSPEPDFSAMRQSTPARRRHISEFVECEARADRPLHVLEVGAWTGESALCWQAAIVRHCPQGGFVLCVDPWESYASAADLAGESPIYRHMDALLKSGEAFDLFRRNIQTDDQQTVPIIWQRGRLTDEAVALRHQFDIVYLDGSHYLADVLADIEVARALVRPGGVLCGDDLEMQGNECDLAVDRALPLVDYVVDHHPGVTVAVWEAFGEVWSRDGVWAVRRGKDGGYTRYTEDP